MRPGKKHDLGSGGTPTPIPLTSLQSCLCHLWSRFHAHTGLCPPPGPPQLLPPATDTQNSAAQALPQATGPGGPAASCISCGTLTLGRPN